MMQNSQKEMVFSYLELRTTIGILGIALPFVLAIGGFFPDRSLQSSISAYYHTDMRGVLVGALWVIGFFLFSYRGCDLRDDIAGDLACLFALGVALFPVAPDHSFSSRSEMIESIHYVFTALFFLTLIYFSLFLFTKTNPDKPPTEQKLQRNKVYKTCGMIMLVCLVLMGIYSALPQSVKFSLRPLHPVFWLEASAILAFGISWFTKGEAILKDESNR